MKQQCILLILLLTTFGAFTMEQELDIREDGKPRKLVLPFEYFKRKETDEFIPVHECAFAAIDLQKQSHFIPVVGQLRPDIGVVVTDGKKILAFNVHLLNHLDSMGSIMRKHLDLSEENEPNRFARIYGTHENAPRAQCKFLIDSRGDNPERRMARIQRYVATKLAVNDSSKVYCSGVSVSVNPQGIIDINTQTHGVYASAPFNIAVRADDLFETGADGAKRIKFYSIDPIKEDVLMVDNDELDVSKDFLRKEVEALALIQWLKENKKQADWLSEGNSIKVRYPHEMPKLSIPARLQLYEGLLLQHQNQYYRQGLGKEREELTAQMNKYAGTQPFYQSCRGEK